MCLPLSLFSSLTINFCYFIKILIFVYILERFQVLKSFHIIKVLLFDFAFYNQFFFPSDLREKRGDLCSNLDSSS